MWGVRKIAAEAEPCKASQQPLCQPRGNRWYYPVTNHSRSMFPPRPLTRSGSLISHLLAMLPPRTAMPLFKCQAPGKHYQASHGHRGQSRVKVSYMQREIQPCAGGGREWEGKGLPTAPPPHTNSSLEVKLQHRPPVFQQRGSIKTENSFILLNVATRDEACFI